MVSKPIDHHAFQNRGKPQVDKTKEPMEILRWLRRLASQFELSVLRT